MSKQTRQQVLDTRRELDALANEVSGKNPDGSDWAMNVSVVSGTVSNPKGGKTFSTSAPTVTATLVLAANSSRIKCMITNNGSQTVYLGKDATVTTATGFPLKTTDLPIDDVNSNDAWWAITESGTGDLRIIEVV